MMRSILALILGAAVALGIGVPGAPIARATDVSVTNPQNPCLSSTTYVAPLSPTYGTHVIGHVTTEGTNYPFGPVTDIAVSGATVRLLPFGRTTTSDASGRFAFCNLMLSADRQLVSVTVDAPGYPSWTITNVEVFTNDATGIDVRLQKGGAPTVIDDSVYWKQRLTRSNASSPSPSPSPSAAASGFASDKVAPATIRVAIAAWANGRVVGYSGVQTVSFEYYVRNVLPKEWGPSWAAASLAAGAMAVKTYAWYWVNHTGKVQLCAASYGVSPPAGYADVDNTTCSQVYSPNTNRASTDAAVYATWGYRMTQSGSIFEAGYGSGNQPPGQMSQEGSKYWADLGYAWPWILHYYYPNTTIEANVLVAENAAYTWVAYGNTLIKYDLGGSGTKIFSPNLNGIGGSHYYGYAQLTYTIAGLAINNGNLYIALSNGRLIKTDMCGSGGNVCAFSDGLGSGSLAGYSYWRGVQDFSYPISSVAASSGNLYTNLESHDTTPSSSTDPSWRTVKTGLCGSGSNMCALANADGTAGLSGYSYWKGYQDWSTPVIAIGANDSYVFNSLLGEDTSVYRGCKTTPGGTGSNIFALADGGCRSSVPGYSYWKGYQDWTYPVPAIAVDATRVWWGLLSQARLVATNMCGSGANACALADGIGTGSMSGYSYWQGRQDWCAGYEMTAVASNGAYVDTGFASSAGDYDRLVQGGATAGGVNMFNAGNCGGSNGAAPWIGYQDLSAPQ